ncbi:tetratricopeptide repeat-containing sensor histidine kinase [Runella sp.]|uniref:tetratricopeptide repeat-containing sensor histidine kinase n=1 Tax=Runella sp. TaxID=1960881 RepID=UPI003D0C116E
MRNFYGFLLFCIISFSTNAQSSGKLDSLRNLLAQLPQEGQSYVGDTARVGVLCEMAWAGNGSIEVEYWLNNAKRIAQNRKWKEGIAREASYRGMVLFGQNLIYQSIDELLNALEIAQSLSNEKLMCFCYRQLGSAYFVLEEDSLAIEYYSKAKQIYQKRFDKLSKRNIALMISNIGLCQNRMQRHDLGIKSFSEAIKISHLLGDSTGLAWYYSNLGSTHKETHQYDQALKNLQTALKYFGSRSAENRAFTHSEIALSYLGFHQPAMALKEIQKALYLAQNGTPYFGSYINKAAYLVYKANGLPIPALKAKEVYDSLKNINDQQLQKRSIEGIQASFDNKKKQLEIDNQSQQNRVLLIGIGVALFLILIILRSFWLLKIKNKEIEEQRRQIESINSQLSKFNQELEQKVAERTQELQKAYDEIKGAMAKGQTYERQRVASELHDNLGGTLTAIKWQLAALDDDSLSNREKNIYDNIMSMIQNAYSDVRNLSHNMLPSQFEKRGLIGALQQLCSDISKDGKITINLKVNDIEGQINPKVAIELYSIFLELITNILKHSMATEALITLNKENDFVFCLIQDNGRGLSGPSEGKGLKNIWNRVSSITDTHNLKFDNQGGLQVSFQIPAAIFFG